MDRFFNVSGSLVTGGSRFWGLGPRVVRPKGCESASGGPGRPSRGFVPAAMATPLTPFRKDVDTVDFFVRKHVCPVFGKET